MLVVWILYSSSSILRLCSCNLASYHSESCKILISCIKSSPIGAWTSNHPIYLHNSQIFHRSYRTHISTIRLTKKIQDSDHNKDSTKNFTSLQHNKLFCYIATNSSGCFHKSRRIYLMDVFWMDNFSLVYNSRHSFCLRTWRFGKEQ